MNPEAIRVAIESRVSAIRTAQEGTVVSVSGSHARVKFGPRPVPTEEDGVYIQEVLPQAYARVMWPAGSGCSLVFGLVPGDKVVVIFLEYDPSGGDIRQHNLANAVCFPVAESSGTATDSFALASYLNTLIQTLLAWAPTGTLADTTTLSTALQTALAPFTGSGSSLVKVDS